MPVLSPSRAGCMAIALAGVLLTGCAYKNPLIEGAAPAPAPVAAATPATSTATGPAPATAIAPTPAATPDVAPATAAAATAGVQTIQERRRFGFLTPYRTDIQQGNFISSEMVAQLKPGMTPDQVRFVLGTPLLTDMFHQNRWDYVFALKRSNGEVTRSQLTLFFRDGRLDRWDGGNLPTEEEYLDRIAGKPARTSKGPSAVPSERRAPSTANEPR